MEWIIFIIHIIFFILLTLFLFTIPGFFILNLRFKDSNFWQNYSLATITGFVFFTLCSYFLSLIGLIFVLLPLILILDFFALKKESLPDDRFKFNRFSITLIIFALAGIIGQLLIISPSGQIINHNLVFWSALGRDGVWHLALIEQIKNGFPFQNPDFAGEKLVNYHFFSDISIASFNYFFKLSSLDLLFRFFPFLFSFLIGILSFQLGKTLGKTNQAGFWSMVFTYFAGSFGYIVTFFKDDSVGGEALFWSSQPQSSSGNPPQNIAFLIVLAVLLLLFHFLEKPNKHLGLGLFLLIGTLAEFKIYASVILLSSLLLIAIWRLIKKRKPDLLFIVIPSTILSVALYLPNTAASNNLLLFEPWWFIRTMVVATDKLDWIDLEHRRQTYLAAHSYLRVAQIETEAFMIFLFGNLGMRFLGFWYFVKNRKENFTDYSLSIILILFISLLLPMLLIQRGVPANTIQFFQYFLLIFGVLAGVSTAQLLQKISPSWLKILLGGLIILLAVPTQLGLLNVFYSRPPFAQISSQEIIALHFLNQVAPQNSVILAPPFEKGIEFHGPTPPIWIWSDTSYVTAISARRSFVSDIEFLDNMGYNYAPRVDIQKQIYTTTDLQLFESLLKQNQINYLYFPKPLKPQVELTTTSLQKIYENNEAEIWKVGND